MPATAMPATVMPAQPASVDPAGGPFELRGIDAATADDLRRGGGPVYVADAQPGYPCRQCLRDAELGEELVLVSYDPFTATSPYRSASPIFLHRQACTSAVAASQVPAQQTCRQLSVRAFDADEMMVDAALVAGTDLAATIGRLLAGPGVDHLHVHNAERGCFAALVRSAAASHG